MPLLEIDRNPPPRTLLAFGVALTCALGFVGWQLDRAGLGNGARAVWATGALLALVFALIVRARRPIYIGWMYAVSPIAFVVSHLILGFVFFFVLTPVAIVLKLSGKDPLRRRFDKSATSYWIERTESRSKSSYFRQF